MLPVRLMNDRHPMTFCKKILQVHCKDGLECCRRGWLSPGRSRQLCETHDV